jgi:hypothetical protein
MKWTFICIAAALMWGCDNRPLVPAKDIPVKREVVPTQVCPEWIYINSIKVNLALMPYEGSDNDHVCFYDSDGLSASVPPDQIDYAVSPPQEKEH